MAGKLFAGMSRTPDGLNFHVSTVVDKPIGVWLKTPGWCAYSYFDVTGADSKMTMAQILIDKHAAELAEQIGAKPADVKTFLEAYIAKIVAANTPKPPKAPKVPAAAKSTGVTVPAPGTTIAKPTDATKEKNLDVIRQAAAKLKGTGETAKAAKKA